MFHAGEKTDVKRNEQRHIAGTYAGQRVLINKKFKKMLWHMLRKTRLDVLMKCLYILF